MKKDDFLYHVFYDMQRNRYKPTKIISSYTQSVNLSTDDSEIVRIIYGIENSKELEKHISWIMSLSNSASLRKSLIIPQSKLIGLKRNEVGYTFDIDGLECLLNLSKPQENERIYQWYFKQTGGVSYRLKLAYILINNLKTIHEEGLCLNNICPTNIFFQREALAAFSVPAMQFLCTEAAEAYMYYSMNKDNDMYMDPLVKRGLRSVSTMSDTYSLYMVIFELITLCHPFIGKQIESINHEDIELQIDAGNLEYIGNNDNTINENEDFEDYQLFLPENLKHIFEQMFIQGKLDISQRPSLQDLKKEITVALRRMITCDNPRVCRRLYPYNELHKCPFCSHITEHIRVVYVYRSVRITKDILDPIDKQGQEDSYVTVGDPINYMVLQSGLNKLTPSFFDKDIQNENVRIGIWIWYDSNTDSVKIENNFQHTTIWGNGRYFQPKDRSKPARVQPVAMNSYPINIELPKNFNVDSEEIISMQDDVYGDIVCQWQVVIK